MITSGLFYLLFRVGFLCVFVCVCACVCVCVCVYVCLLVYACVHAVFQPYHNMIYKINKNTLPTFLVWICVCWTETNNFGTILVQHNLFSTLTYKILVRERTGKDINHITSSFKKSSCYVNNSKKDNGKKSQETWMWQKQTDTLTQKQLCPLSLPGEGWRVQKVVDYSILSTAKGHLKMGGGGERENSNDEKKKKKNKGNIFNLKLIQVEVLVTCCQTPSQLWRLIIT